MAEKAERTTGDLTHHTVWPQPEEFHGSRGTLPPTLHSALGALS